MNVQMIIAPVAGSIIGYTTNWLAIKMLFKPHKAYHIGKIKVPFTPGLIPRERVRIAKSLGEAVGGNLLTEEVILKELTNEAIITSLKDYVIMELLGKSITFENLVSKMYAKPDECYKMISRALINQLQEYMEKNKSLKGVLGSQLAQRFGFQETIESFLADQYKETISAFVMDRRVEIANGICLFLEQDEIATKMKGLISSVLTQKLGGLAAMFVEPNSLYEMILDFVRTSLEKEENQIEVVNQINKVIEGLMSKKVSDLLESNEYIHILDGISDMVYGEVKGFLEGPGFMSMLQDLIKNIAIKEIMLPVDLKEGIENGVETLYLNFAKSRLPIFLEQFNVSNIVETEINNFSVQEVENLIFKIVDNELKAITWIGALLGFVMGTITLFF